MTPKRDELPAELLSFIHTCIDSVEQLQVLLLLQEPGPGAWTVDSISAELRTSKAAVQKRLHDLETCRVLQPGSLEPNGGIRYRPTSPEVARLANQLRELFRQRPHRVIAQIFARPCAPLQPFADAFKIKKKEDP